MPLSDGVIVPRRVGVRESAKKRTRQEILDAAAVAFTEQGYNSTSLRDVAARAGLSHTGLLHHFPDKPSLLEAVLDDRLESPSRTLPLDSTDGETFLLALIDLAELDVVEPASIALFTVLSAEALSPTHPAHEYFRRWHARVRELTEAAFVDLEARGRFHGRVTPRMAALHVSSMRDGLNLDWLLEPDEIDLVQTIRAQFEVYVDLSPSVQGKRGDGGAVESAVRHHPSDR